MGIGRYLRIGLLGLALAISSRALAQDASSNLFLSPEDTRECICLEDQVNGMREELDASKQASEGVAAEFARLDTLVEQARDSIDVNDEAEVDSFRRLFNRREELRQQLSVASRPYDQLIGRYNRIAMTYNSQCANRKMFKVNVDAARADPQCEAMP